LGFNLNIRYDSIAENIVFNVYAKFNDDRLLYSQNLGA